MNLVAKRGHAASPRALRMRGTARYLFGAASRCVTMNEKLRRIRGKLQGARRGKAQPGGGEPVRRRRRRRICKNMMRVGQQSQKLLTDFFKRQSAGSKEPLDPLNIAEPFLTLIKAMTARSDSASRCAVSALERLPRSVGSHRPQDAGRRGRAGGPARAGRPPFRDKDWQENQIFDFIKQSYLLTANWMQDTVAKSGRHPDDDTQARRFLHQAIRRRDSRRPISSSPIPKCCARRCNRTARTWSRAWTICSADLERGQGQLSIRQIGRRLQGRREHRHRARQGGLPERADAAAAVRPRHRRSL